MFNLIANAAAAAAAPAHDAGFSLMPASMCVKEEGASPYGLVPALCEGGVVSQVTFLVLLIMFIGTLYILFTKLFEQNKVINQGKAVDANFWRAPTLADGAATVSYTHLDVYKRQQTLHNHICDWACIIARRCQRTYRLLRRKQARRA